MPEEEIIERAREDEREGKSPSTQAGEFVREEMEHIRQGEHGARSPEQAIAIGLSKARRAGVKLPPQNAARTNKAPGKARSRKGPCRTTHKAFSKTLPCNETRAQAGEPSLRIKAGIVETREAGGGATLGALAFGRREESSAHTKASPLRRA